jgi:hypothetical protein
MALARISTQNPSAANGTFPTLRENWKQPMRPSIAPARKSRMYAADAVRYCPGLLRVPSTQSRLYAAGAHSRTGPVPQLEQLRLQALEWRMDAGLALGQHSEIVGEPT